MAGSGSPCATHCRDRRVPWFTLYPPGYSEMCVSAVATTCRVRCVWVRNVCQVRVCDVSGVRVRAQWCRIIRVMTTQHRVAEKNI